MRREQIVRRSSKGSAGSRRSLRSTVAIRTSFAAKELTLTQVPSRRRPP
jgi:hypothetical protein